MQLSDELLKDIELKFLRELMEALEKGSMDEEQAKSSAHDFLALLPFANYDDMKTKIESFCKTYPELLETHVYILQKEEEQKTQSVVEKMRTFMKNDQIDEAINVVQENK